jgi:VWFA-related protein
MRASLLYFLALILSVTGLAQQRSVTFLRLGTDIIQKKLGATPDSPQARIKALRGLFMHAGCSGRILEQPSGGVVPNLLCSTPSISDDVIVIAAPVDYHAKGDEAATRWSDLVMLPILAESLGSVLTRHKLVFAAMSGGSEGQGGAKQYLEQLSPEARSHVHAVVAFDHLGRAAPVYSVPNSGAGVDIRTGRFSGVGTYFHTEIYPITRSVPTAARRWGFETPPKTSEFGIGLVRPFHQEKIPAITFSSPAWTIVRYIGNNPIRDYRNSIDLKLYNQTYLFLCAYLLHLDHDLGSPADSPDIEIAEALYSAQTETLDSLQKLRTQTTPPVPVIQASVAPPPTPVPPAAVVGSAPVFRATSRLVQVDVVVTDKSGRPVEDLKRENFTVLQDGRQQSARIFEAHKARDAISAGGSQAPSHVLGSYSNQPDATSKQSWNIILFDLLNTPTEDQQTARKQLQKIAQSLPVGQPVALFALSTHLVMVQPFTTDGKTFLAAVHNFIPQHSQVLTTEAERQREVGTATYASERLTDINLPANAGINVQAIADFQADTTSRLLNSTKELQAMRLDERANFTLDAFQGLARALAGYPGRKNLIWLSGNFPMQLLPDNNSKDKWRYSITYQNQVARTAALLTEARVAVYPIDIRGMQIRGIDVSTSTAQSAAFVGNNSTTLPSTTPNRTSDLIADQTFIGMQERKTMMEVAELTGGRAFLNTNDFDRAIATAIEDGSIYYTLAYAPDTKDEKTTYHRIEVQLDKPNLHLSYRRGYYALPEQGDQKTGLAALQGSLQPGMPPSTMLFFTASVDAPAAPGQSVRVHYLINGSNVSLGDAANGAKHIVVDCMAIAYDKDGKEAGHASDTLDGVLPPDALQATLSRGLPASQELKLKPGVYNIRLGVQDRESQRIGTLTIPIKVD